MPDHKSKIAGLRNNMEVIYHHRSRGYLFDVIGPYKNIGLVYENQGQYDYALNMYKMALDMESKHARANYSDIADLYNAIGTMHKDYADIADLYTSLGNIYCSLLQYDKALSLLEKALNMRIKLHGKNHLDVIDAYANLRILYFSQSNNEKVLMMLERVLNIKLKLCGKNCYEVTNSYTDIGNLYVLLFIFDDAMAMHRKALSIGLKLY
ncbi:Kinesin light chain 2 [Trichoplax sp. H2]|nr:Kinesin light chain 2 [Trichoplax sp. H2]|eukprot:RDD37543.1 Kinesin light chain 2 [Trichoplax sp. H2]